MGSVEATTARAAEEETPGWAAATAIWDSWETGVGVWVEVKVWRGMLGREAVGGGTWVAGWVVTAARAAKAVG
jgi:hypothetical protein